jgi:hypothetical protein
MAKKIAPLTDKAVLNAKPEEKARKLFDGSGLFLLINPDGGRYWRLKYRYGGTEKLLALGTYPQISLADARKKAADARKLLQQDIDPAEQRKADKETKAAEQNAERNTFQSVALEWYERKRIGGWAATFISIGVGWFVDALDGDAELPQKNIPIPMSLKVVTQCRLRRCWLGLTSCLTCGYSVCQG